MINYIFAFVNVLAVFFYSLFIGDGGITVSNNFPKNLNPGQSAKVELKVTKGSQSGFAKLQIELPEGVTITEIDNKGADFTLVEGIGKWVWSTLPSDAELIVKFNLTALENANGVKTISAKYSYVENNAKQIAEMPAHELTIGGSSTGISEVTATTNTTSNASSTTTETPVTSTNTTTTSNQTASNGEPIANINVVRTITKTSNPNEYLVDLKIKKGSTKGFARYSDEVQDGITAKADKTEGSSFSVADRKLKFVWVNVPEKEDLNISYIVSSSKNLIYALNGEYSYLEENQSKKYKVPTENIEFKTEAVVSNTESNNNTNSTNSATTNTSTNTETNTIASTATETKSNTTENNSSNSSSTNNTSTETVSKVDASINFRVQIGAYTGQVSTGRLKSIHKLNDKINSEMVDGFSKFMIGNYPQYKDAHDKRDMVKSNNGINGAFVVAYNQGKRVTVQEALMMVNQKWFK